jgi:hypothetical protein
MTLVTRDIEYSPIETEVERLWDLQKVETASLALTLLVQIFNNFKSSGARSAIGLSSRCYESIKFDPAYGGQSVSRALGVPEWRAEVQAEADPANAAVALLSALAIARFQVQDLELCTRSDELMLSTRCFQIDDQLLKAHPTFLANLRSLTLRFWECTHLIHDEDTRILSKVFMSLQALESLRLLGGEWPREVDDDAFHQLIGIFKPCNLKSLVLSFLGIAESAVISTLDMFTATLKDLHLEQTYLTDNGYVLVWMLTNLKLDSLEIDLSDHYLHEDGTVEQILLEDGLYLKREGLVGALAGMPG